MNPFLPNMILLAVFAVAGLLGSAYLYHALHNEKVLRVQGEAGRDHYKHLAEQWEKAATVSDHHRNNDRQRHAQDLEQLREHHRSELKEVYAAHQAALEDLARLSQYGTRAPGAAIVDPRDPESPEQAALRQVTEASITKGAQVIKEAYSQKGLIITEEEARNQATSMLLLRPPVATGGGPG